ncbi:Small conductance calcium-activated potassium channel protein [Trichinella spiralis]|uniref:Small conductance calcium-activated potassium channel protein n=1 Tax=Trichinella spiralis TaxID=6334 RepID=A0A0V1B3A6_TRISP|nr:Small conductance calcium-activated potassium channel protein [Trichinella spiralis]
MFTWKNEIPEGPKSIISKKRKINGTNTLHIFIAIPHSSLFMMFNCSWPDSQNENALKFFVLADTHILGDYKGHWFDKLRREWQMKKCFQTSVRLFNPDAVFVLGDLFDEGMWSDEKRFKKYTNDFYDIFSANSTPLYAVIGNHDVGFHDQLHPLRLIWFYDAFGMDIVELVVLKRYPFILVNSMAMENDQCIFCSEAVRMITSLNLTLQCAKDGRNGNCYFGNVTEYIKPIVMQLLEILQPRAVFSGHTHHGCRALHNDGEVLEWTVSSYSWRNKNNPAFLMVTVTDEDVLVNKCQLPRESTKNGLILSILYQIQPGHLLFLNMKTISTALLMTADEIGLKQWAAHLQRGNLSYGLCFLRNEKSALLTVIDMSNKSVVKNTSGHQLSRPQQVLFGGKTPSADYDDIDKSPGRNVRYFSLALDKDENPAAYSEELEAELPGSSSKENCNSVETERQSLSSPTLGTAHLHPEERNPLYEVSNEYMRIIGGQQVFKSLLKKHSDSRQSLRNKASNATDLALKSINEAEPESRTFFSDTKLSLESDWTARLRRRKMLFYRRIRINDYCFLLALVGIGVVVIENEFHNTTYISLNRTGADDWRVALTTGQIIQLATEIVICSVVPLPADIMIDWTVVKEDRLTTESVKAPLNAILSVLMVCRLYLLGRFMALRSKQFQDAATRSIAALNRITVDFAFILKSLMYENPIKVLLLFTGVLWLVMAWMFRQFNGNHDEYLYSNSIWFVIITFLSIGYGDVTPTTYCGRGVSITTGIIGAGVSSALIAVISRQMELTRAEKQVNNFMSESKLSRQRIKWEQRKTSEEGNALVDVAKMQKTMHEAVFDMKKTQEVILNRIESLCKTIQLLNSAGNQLASNARSPS